MSTKDVAVVILNYNGKDFLTQFLPSVCQYSGDAKIVVADNNSSDDSISFLEKEYAKKVEIIKIATNLGFCGGYNYALKQVKTKYVVLLNSDVEVTPNWLEPLVELMEAQPTIGACQPKIKSFTAKDKFEYAGAAGGFIDKWGYPYCRGRIFDTLETDHGQYDQDSEIFWATGCALMIRSEIYHHLKGLDEDFFAHMEEIDLCWRILNYGYKVYYSSKSVVYHVGGGTLNKENPRKTFFNFRNSLMVMLKNLPTASVFFLIFWRMILDGIAGIKFLVEGKPSHAWAIMKAHFSFYSHIPKMWHKRTDLYLHKESGYQLMSPFSIVYQYFVKKKTVYTKLKNH